MCVYSIFFNCVCFGVVKKFVIVFLVLVCFIGLKVLIFVINYFIFFKIFLLCCKSKLVNVFFVVLFMIG